MSRADRFEKASAACVRAYRQVVSGKSKLTVAEIAEMFSSEFMLDRAERAKLARLLPRRGGKK